jgi:hypothetical protein
MRWGGPAATLEGVLYVALLEVTVMIYGVFAEQSEGRRATRGDSFRRDAAVLLSLPTVRRGVVREAPRAVKQRFGLCGGCSCEVWTQCG